MPTICCVRGCKSRGLRDDVKFFQFPRIRFNVLNELSVKRQQAWLKAVNRDDLTPARIKYAAVCSKHFISGRSADLKDCCSPDWVPTLLMTFDPKQVKLRKKKSEIDFIDCTPEIDDYESYESEDEEEPSTRYSARLKIKKLKLKHKFRTIGVQTDGPSNGPEMKSPKEEFSIYETILREQVKVLEQRLQLQAVDLTSFQRNDEKTKYFTGLDKFDLLDVLYNYLTVSLPLVNSLSPFLLLMLTLMKLRLDLPFAYLGYKFGIPTAQAWKYFEEIVPIVSSTLSDFMFWPDNKDLDESTPKFLELALKGKRAIIMDFFEVLIEKENSTITVKFLIAMAPNGRIIFLSKGFDGTCNNTFITDNSGILDNLVSVDIILEKGLFIQKVITSEIYLPDSDLTKTTIDLQPIYIENNINCALVRVHVERLIDSLRRQYVILESKLPFSYTSPRNGDESFLDQILKACCALVNVNHPLLPD